jgi:hypothetical protein
MARVTCLVSHTTIDCADAYRLSEWWKHLLGYVDLPDDPNLPGHDECMILDPETGHRLLFIEVPEGRSVKNRVHLDLRPRAGTRDAEVERVRALGAVEVADLRGKYGPGTGWVHFADPEGNDFCVLGGPDDLAAQGVAGEASGEASGGD